MLAYKKRKQDAYIRCNVMSGSWQLAGNNPPSSTRWCRHEDDAQLARFWCFGPFSAHYGIILQRFCNHNKMLSNWKTAVLPLLFYSATVWYQGGCMTTLNLMIQSWKSRGAFREYVHFIIADRRLWVYSLRYILSLFSYSQSCVRGWCARGRR